MLDNSEFLTCPKCNYNRFEQFDAHSYDITNKKATNIIDGPTMLRCLKCGYTFEKPNCIIIKKYDNF